MKRFENRHILVTGGTSGIGLATVRRLHDEGAKLIVTGTREERLAALRAEYPDLLAVRNDAGDVAAAGELAARVAAHCGRLDGLFLNAGVGTFNPTSAVSAAEFDRQFDVNVKGPLFQAQALVPLLRDGGAIVLNSSTARDLALPNSAVYAATKGAIRSFTRVLAMELAPRNVRVNAVSPGPVETDFFARSGLSDEQVSEWGAMMAPKLPLGRYGKPHEVAAVACFLLSDDASYVTGSEYVVDGGLTELA